MKIVSYGLLEDILLPDGENLEFVPGAEHPSMARQDIFQEIGDGYTAFMPEVDDESPSAISQWMEQHSRKPQIH